MSEINAPQKDGQATASRTGLDGRLVGATQSENPPHKVPKCEWLTVFEKQLTSVTTMRLQFSFRVPTWLKVWCQYQTMVPVTAWQICVSPAGTDAG